MHEECTNRNSTAMPESALPHERCDTADPESSSAETVGGCDVIATLQNVLRKVEPSVTFPLIQRTTTLDQLGVDSVAVMEIIGYMEDEFDVVIPDETLMSIRTVGDVVDAVSAQRP
jgi:acyl carrier protein